MASSVSGFVSKHPWMTFFLALAGISGTVAVVESVSGVRVFGAADAFKKMVGGAPQPGAPQLPPKRVA